MAAKKKVRRKVRRSNPRTDDGSVWADAAADVLERGVTAIHQSRNAQGELDLEVDVEEEA